MTISMHRVSVSTFEQMLTSLDAVLDKMAAFCEARGIDPMQVIRMRLAPDMYDLGEQVQRAAEHVSAAVRRLAGEDMPRKDLAVLTLPELKALIAEALADVRAATPEALDGSETREIAFEIRPGPIAFSGEDYLLCYALPQVYFHVTTAYDIIRHAGVEIGKIDFLGIGMQRRIA